MNSVTEFLDRLARRVDEHFAAQKDQFTTPGLKLPPPAKFALDTAGLGLEATANLGQYAAGEAALPLAAFSLANLRLTGGDLNHPAAVAYQKALDAGPLHPQEALDALRNSGVAPLSYGAGAGAMALDPSNLIPLPVGAKARAGEEVLRAARKSATFADTPAGRKVLGELAQEAAPTEVDPYAEAIARLTEKPDLEAIFRRYDAAKSVPDMTAGVTDAESELQRMTDVYKDVQGQKAAAVRDVKAPLQVNGRLPKGVKDTPEFLRAADDAKTLVERLNPEGPQARETFSEWLRPHRDLVARAKAEQDNAVGQVRNAMLNTQPSPITPEEAKLLSQTPGTLPEGDLRGELPGELNARYNAMEGGPEDVRRGTLVPSPVSEELDPATGKAVLTDPNGWFKAEVEPGQVPQNPIARELTAVANPAKALDGSNPLTESSHAGHMWDMIKTAMAQGWAKNIQSFSQPWKKVGLQDVAGVWAGVNIETGKNLIGDILFNRFVLLNEGIARRAMTSNETLMAYRIAQGETKPHLLFGRLGDYMERLGLDVNDPKLVEQVRKDLGASMFEIEADTAARLDEINGLQKAIVGTGLQLASPTRAVTSLLTAPGNLFITMRHHVFHVINNVTHTSARVAAFEDAFLPLIENSAKDMLERAAAEGLDVSELAGKGLTDVTDKANGVLASEGFFNPDKVRAVLGDRYAAEWEATINHAFQQGFDRSKQVLGNYQLDGALGAAEKQIRKFVPFMSWAWRAYPRAAKYALQHPAVTVALLHLVAADRHQAQQEGRPGYQVGTIPINKDTPVVGLLASVFSPEQEATVRVNPLALVSPLGGEQLSLGMDGGTQPENVYQQAAKGLGVVGASFNPLIQTAAYITGADYKAPGNASRYSPIDQYVGAQTGVETPTIQGPLRAARAGVTAALGDKQVDTYDPVEARAKELVYERTGQPLEALGPTSQYAKDIAAKQGIYKEAEETYLRGNAARAAVNSVSPVSSTVTTKTTEARRAEGKPPFSYDDIQAMKDQGLTKVVTAMQQANDAWYKQHPAAAVNRDAPKPEKGEGAGTDPRVLAWEAEHVFLKKQAPNSYAAALKAYKASLPKK